MARHLVLLVEEPSMEAFLQAMLPRVLPAGLGFEVHPFQLLAKLEDRLKAYAQWLPADWRLLVIVDRDDDDCAVLKARLEAISHRARLVSRTRARGTRRNDWQVANRIAIEELEAWYFGDWPAAQAVFPKLPDAVPRSRGFRDPDAIPGGTWEAFERVLRRHGYAKSGLAKIETARNVGQYVDLARNRSKSFQAFHAALVDAWTGG